LSQRMKRERAANSLARCCLVPLDDLQSMTATAEISTNMPSMAKD